MRTLVHPERDQLQLTTILAALSDPIRLRLIRELALAGEMPCGEFASPVAKSTMSHHVRTLREAGVLRVRLQGTQRRLSLRSEDLDARFPGLLSAVLQADASVEDSARSIEPEPREGEEGGMA
ncbi:helix-turn-helix transcriptional regulator [Paenibacillus sp. IB182496]|uniref:Helix-turn-helix transcriptional regulator n=1 Tax=Paenibacillus sabuli TaxID=2772509 RepID=A0A927BTM7_9BACL|nr:helix-turn-helix domain-containing protein [Paenibacillus sabuli]MBD2846082.1 helix-turn-helix transcriptional regulator [Paenibacillus sabuli]